MFGSEQDFSVRRLIRSALAGGAVLVAVSALGAPEATHAVRLVHRFLNVEISPDGKWVASVEGDSPVNGNDPPVRQLVIRAVGGQGETRVNLPCGQVEQCWPGFPTTTRLPSFFIASAVSFSISSAKESIFDRKFFPGRI